MFNLSTYVPHHTNPAPNAVSGVEFQNVEVPQGQEYYVFNVSPSAVPSPPLIDFTNPYVIFILGMMLAFGISYLAYYIKKHNYTYEQVWKTFCGLIGLSGIGILFFGIVDIVFVGREGIVYPLIGILFIYAGGSFLKDMDEDYEKSQECEK